VFHLYFDVLLFYLLQMLTVFQSNKPAFNFYRHIGFEVDAQDPSNFGMFEEDYFIMSRKC
jgi:ribosomal protein S18 acetylase RimI-like enzyme